MKKDVENEIEELLAQIENKYKDQNESTHFEKQLSLQKQLHNKSNKNKNQND